MHQTIGQFSPITEMYDLKDSNTTATEEIPRGGDEEHLVNVFYTIFGDDVTEY